MAKLNYPTKPWTDGQIASLVEGMEFMFSGTLRKWIPITPGSSNSSQLESAFRVSTLKELIDKYTIIEKDVSNLDSDIKNKGRIWKTQIAPTTNVYENDVWIDTNQNKMYSWDATGEVWVEINYIG